MMKKTVSDLMTTAVKIVSPDESLTDLERALVDAKVSGFPVVDKTNALVGVVSRADIVRQLNIEQSLAEYIYDYYRDVQHYNNSDTPARLLLGERIGIRLEHLRVKDIMTHPAIIISPTASLADLAKILTDYHIQRVPVVEGRRLVGVVSAFDLVQLFAKGRVEAR